MILQCDSIDRLAATECRFEGHTSASLVLKQLNKMAAVTSYLSTNKFGGVIVS